MPGKPVKSGVAMYGWSAEYLEPTSVADLPIHEDIESLLPAWFCGICGEEIADVGMFGCLCSTLPRKRGDQWGR